MEELPRWFNSYNSTLPIQEGPDSFPGQGARAHMPQLKTPSVALGPSVVKINITKKKRLWRRQQNWTESAISARHPILQFLRGSTGEAHTALSKTDGNQDGTAEDAPEPHHTSARWQSLSPGSLHKSTTSLQMVSGVTGTSVKCCSLLLRYTVRNIWKQKEKHKGY